MSMSTPPRQAPGGSNATGYNKINDLGIPPVPTPPMFSNVIIERYPVNY